MSKKFFIIITLLIIICIIIINIYVAANNPNMLSINTHFYSNYNGFFISSNEKSIYMYGHEFSKKEFDESGNIMTGYINEYNEKGKLLQSVKYKQDKNGNHVNEILSLVETDEYFYALSTITSESEKNFLLKISKYDLSIISQVELDPSLSLMKNMVLCEEHLFMTATYYNAPYEIFVVNFEGEIIKTINLTRIFNIEGINSMDITIKSDNGRIYICGVGMKSKSQFTYSNFIICFDKNGTRIWSYGNLSDKYNDMLIKDDIIYIAGSTGADSIIKKYDINGSYLNEYLYHNERIHSSFERIMKYDDKFLILGSSENSNVTDKINFDNEEFDVHLIKYYDFYYELQTISMKVIMPVHFFSFTNGITSFKNVDNYININKFINIVRPITTIRVIVLIFFILIIIAVLYYEFFKTYKNKTHKTTNDCKSR